MSCFPGKSVFIDRNRNVYRVCTRWIKSDDFNDVNSLLEDPSNSVAHDNGFNEVNNDHHNEFESNNITNLVDNDEIKQLNGDGKLSKSGGKLGPKKALSVDRTRKKGSKKCVKKDVSNTNKDVDGRKIDDSIKNVTVNKRLKVVQKVDNKKVDSVKNQKSQSCLSRRRISDWVSRSSEEEKCHDKGSKNVAKATRRPSSSMSSRSKASDDKKEKTAFQSELDIGPLLPNDNYTQIDSFAPADSERSLSDCSSLSSSSSSLSSSCSRHSIIKHYTDIIMNREGVADAKNGSVKSKIDRILKSQWEDRLNRSKEKSDSNGISCSGSSAPQTSFILRPSKLQINKKTWLKLKKSNSRNDWLFNATTTTSSQSKP